ARICALRWASASYAVLIDSKVSSGDGRQSASLSSSVQSNSTSSPPMTCAIHHRSTLTECLRMPSRHVPDGTGDQRSCSSVSPEHFQSNVSREKRWNPITPSTGPPDRGGSVRPCLSMIVSDIGFSSLVFGLSGKAYWLGPTYP